MKITYYIEVNVKVISYAPDFNKIFSINLERTFKSRTLQFDPKLVEQCVEPKVGAAILEA